ncbi:AAA family ATPase [Nocardia huaxiensis]|uniref:AAA family ATPase n=1 Tax=Nocardia huaxiensis TaxID=2755382 RepID=A0A7D6ZJ35_9NOCA|nr:AAA family ATPase [Nocardia huaxiensis]
MVIPDRVHDLRGNPIDELRYPASAAVIITGVPGAGKSTALRKLFGLSSDGVGPAVSPAGAVLIDSQHARNSWQRRLGAVPYPLWLPIVHVTHYARIRAALRDAAGPVIIHDCGTRQWVRRLVAAWARATDRPVHLIMIDAPAELAWAGQIARGRKVRRWSFALHCLKWRRLVGAVAAGTKPRPEPISVVILDRAAVTELHEVSFAA